MRLRNWLSFCLLVGWAGAQSLEAARPLAPAPLLSHTLLEQLAGEVTVLVKVRIGKDGSVDPHLAQGSGVAEVDEGLLKILKGWRWRPARREGEPIESVQALKMKLKFYP